MLFFHRPVITVCIPVYMSEQYLDRCLESVAAQNFSGVEVVVVDDCSPANSAGDIVKQFKKKSKIPVAFIRHSQNLGLVEARRSAVYQAKGDYIFILDSDDTLAPGALSVLYEKAVESGAHIVQGHAEAVFSDTVLNELDPERSQNYKKSILKKINNVHPGELTGPEILDSYLVNQTHHGILWGKLFAKETYLEALGHIPPVFCTMAEDVIQYFWLARCAGKYASVNHVVYNYSINTGISSRTKIESLERWEKVCSTASVFSAIFFHLEENPDITITKEQENALRSLIAGYVANNLTQLKAAVVPELQKEAEKLLEDYWGEDLVQNVKKIMATQK